MGIPFVYASNVHWKIGGGNVLKCYSGFYSQDEFVQFLGSLHTKGVFTLTETETDKKWLYGIV